MEPCEQESEVKWRSLIWLLYETQEGAVVGWAYGGEALVARLRGGSARS